MTDRIFVALDIETTGLDPEIDTILEIAWEVLDSDLNSLFPDNEPRTYILDQSDWQGAFNRIRNNPLVQKMHHESGLLGDLLGTAASPAWRVAEDLKRDFSNAVALKGYDVSFHLLGLSVDFDRSFLRVHPEFEKFFPNNDSSGTFHHRVFDLTPVKILWDIAGLAVPTFKNEDPHRALSDVVEVIETARYFRNDLAERLA